MKTKLNKIVLSLSIPILLIFTSGVFAADLRCKDPASRTKPVREDLNNRINFECEEYEEEKPQISCEDVSGTYAMFATFDSSQCAISFSPLKSFVIYITQTGCSITVSYEDDLNPDIGNVEGSTATFSGTSLIGSITDIHTVSVTKEGSTVTGSGSSTISGPSIKGCVVAKSIVGNLVDN